MALLAHVTIVTRTNNNYSLLFIQSHSKLLKDGPRQVMCIYSMPLRKFCSLHAQKSFLEPL